MKIDEKKAIEAINVLNNQEIRRKKMEENIIAEKIEKTKEEIYDCLKRKSYNFYTLENNTLYRKEYHIIGDNSKKDFAIEGKVNKIIYYIKISFPFLLSVNIPFYNEQILNNIVVKYTKKIWLNPILSLRIWLFSRNIKFAWEKSMSKKHAKKISTILDDMKEFF